ncbi:unnamed protein product [Tilletia controversa]|nr:unnamed protein product [Tilletia controversa]CAD6927943.1 unnamed protein product [Tilletia controversa]CAD6950116.1 unnamed protein product [Tilletia caries]
MKDQPADTAPNTVIRIREVIKIMNEEMCVGPDAQVVAPFDTSFDADIFDADIDIDEVLKIVEEEMVG